MKRLNQVIITAVLTIGIFSLVFVTSCKNKCGSTSCQNGGTCVSNTCVCPTGYSGNACQTGWSDVSIGTYVCTRSNCHPAVSGTGSWQSAVTKSATDGGFTINIANFNNSNTTIVATIDSNINGISKITISPAVGSYGVDATGTYSNGVISLVFTSAGAGGLIGYNCNMTMKKE